MSGNDAPYVSVAGDGRFAAVVERGRASVVRIPDGTLAGEYALASGAQVAWLGAPSRLLVISPGPGYQTAQLIDPAPAPRELLDDPVPEDETRVEATARLAATAEDYALLLGAQGATLVQALGMKLGLSRFLTLTVPSVAGTAGRRFVVAIGGTIEEWDPKQRAAIRRVRLRIPVHNEITAVGGSERRFWMITRDTPSRIDVIVDISRGRPDAYELPEPIASVARHPQRELLACIGRDTGQLYVLSLDGQLAPRAVAVEGLDAVDSVAFCPGQTIAMVAARAGKPVMIVGSDGKPLGGAPTMQPRAAAAPPPPPVPADDRGEHAARARPRVGDERDEHEGSPQPPALDARSARSERPRPPPGDHDAQLALLRRVVVATIERALARDLAGDTPGGDADDPLSAELRDARAALAQGTTMLDGVCREHEVDAIGAQVLLFVAAPALWGELARRYTALANDPSRAVCDEHLLVQLLGDTISRRELARALDPGAPLVRRGLVRVGERARPFQPLAADPIVVKLLAGHDLGDEPGIQRAGGDVPLDRVVAPPAVIERAVTDLAAAPPARARVVVRGRTGAGRRTLLAALAHHAGRSLAMIDVGPLVRDQRLRELPVLLQRAHLRGWLPCVDGLEAIASDDAAARGVIRDAIRDHHGPVAMRLPHYMQPPIEPEHVLVDLLPLTRAERVEQWQAALSEQGRIVRDLDGLAERFVIGTGTIRRVAALLARATERDPDRAVDSALRQHLAARLPAIATRVTQLASWTDVVLPDDVQSSLGELVARIRHRHTVFEAWGFDRLMTAPRGVTALLEGERGTGKSLVAGAIAADLGVDLYRIDLAAVLATWSGEIEQHLGRVFDLAEQAQAVLVLEQAEQLVEQRAGAGQRDVALAYLLQRFDAYDGVVILTVNAGTPIDDAVARRISARLALPFPDEAARERLWRVHLPPDVPVRGTLDLAALAGQNRMSGGGIRDAALRAAFLAAAEGSPIAQEHLERAVRSELFEAADG